MEPAARVRWVVETARGVLDGRLSADQAASSVQMQRDQLVGLLRNDRLNVTQRECDSVATTLRLLAEQVSDQASSLGDNEDHLAIAEALGSLAQALR
jgi:hypothetical protein